MKHKILAHLVIWSLAMSGLCAGCNYDGNKSGKPPVSRTDKLVISEPKVVVKTGMTADEVSLLLGKPDRVSYDKDSTVVWYYYSKDSSEWNKTHFVLFEKGKVFASTNENKLFFDAVSIHVNNDNDFKTTVEYTINTDTSDLCVLKIYSSKTTTLHCRQIDKRLFGYTVNKCSIDSIVILNKKNQKYIQTIVPEWNVYSCNNNPIVDIGDITFDGYDDLSIMEFLPAGPNVPHLNWTYEPAQKKYVRNKEMDAVFISNIDYKNKVINTYIRENAANYRFEVFKITNGKPVLVLDTLENYDSESYRIRYTIRKLVNGKMKVVKRYSKKWVFE